MQMRSSSKEARATAGAGGQRRGIGEDGDVVDVRRLRHRQIVCAGGDHVARNAV
jgi:hypothetical protein